MIEVMPISKLSARDVAEALPGGIFYDDANTGLRTVTVCGNACTEKDEVIEYLRSEEISVNSVRCLGACAAYGKLDEGAYAEVPVSVNERRTVVITT